MMSMLTGDMLAIDVLASHMMTGNVPAGDKLTDNMMMCDMLTGNVPIIGDVMLRWSDASS